MKTARSIDEIYEDAKRYDIVISNDAALVTALNNRINVPKVGRLASTPKMIAEDHQDAVLQRLMDADECTDDGVYGIMDDVRLLESICDLTGFDIRFVHGEVENIREIRKYTKEVEKYLIGRPSKRIYEAFSKLPTYEMVMSSFDPSEHGTYDGKKVAIIGLDMFNDLDKHFIPADFKEIQMFSGGRYDIGTVYAVGNDRQVAEHAVDLISKENAEDTAIVMDSTGPIADAVRSALYRKGIGFENTLSAKDIVNIRDYLEFIRKALLYEILTVGDVRELFASYRASADSRYDEYLLHRYEPMAFPDFRELSETMKNVRKYTFAELCEKIVRDRYKGTVKMVLDEIGISDKKINERTEGAASYLIRSMEKIKHNAEIPDSEKKGVLLADCRNSMFIDRPFVIYLNMDAGWSIPNVGKEYIDRDADEEKDKERFQALLQQGTSRIYIVNTMKNGKAARPCTLFDRLNLNADGSPKRINKFEDLDGINVKKGMWISSGVKKKPAERPAPSNVRPIGDLSKSSMNSYVTCPRAYMLGELVRLPDTEGTVFGIMVHEFAEFCLCYPKVAKDNIGVCADMISDVCAGISCPERKELDRSKITAAIDNIAKFIFSMNISAPLNVDIGTKKHKNRFFERFGKNMTSDMVEKDIHSKRNPLHGMFDLMIGNKVIDYKSGGPLSTSDIAGKMDLTKATDYYELQPLVYLSILDDVLSSPGSREFILFFALDNEKDSADPEFNVMDNTRSVVLLDMRKNDIIRSGMLMSLVTETKGRRFIRDEIGEGFTNALLEAGAENAKDWANDEELFEKILSLQTKRTKAVTDAIRKAISLAGDMISGCMIKDGTRILLPRESIESFKEYVKKIHARMNEQQLSGFPYEPRKDCGRCGFLQMCTGGGAVEPE